jgi:hypothetical protein
MRPGIMSVSCTVGGQTRGAKRLHHRGFLREEIPLMESGECTGQTPTPRAAFAP